MSVNVSVNNKVIFGYLLITMFMVMRPHLSFAQNTTQLEAEGDALLEQQDFAAAEKKFSAILNTKSAQPGVQVYYKRAYAYFGLEQFDNALRDVNKYIQKNATDLEAKLLRANIYQALGNADAALTDINALVAVNQNPELLQWRASVAMQAGNYKLAQGDLEKLIGMQGGSAELEAYLGLTYYYLDKQDSALLVFNQVIKKHPEYIQTYVYAGALCLEAGEYELAIQYVDKGLRSAPANETLLFYKGAALVEKPETLTEGCRCLFKAFAAGFDDAGDYLKEYCYGVTD